MRETKNSSTFSSVLLQSVNLKDTQAFQRNSRKSISSGSCPKSLFLQLAEYFLKKFTEIE